MIIIAHRGDTTHHPENTLEAFEAAVRNGADSVEFDVHISHDGILFVHHDYYLGDPDNGTGRIYEKDTNYLRELVVPPSSHIPTLNEVFDRFGRTIRYEIEVKSFTEASLDKIMQLVVRHGLIDMIEFTSPHDYVLTHLKTLNPRAQIGMFIAQPPSWMDRQLAQTIAIHNALLGNVDVLHCSLSFLDPSFIKIAHTNKLRVHAADCDTDEAIRFAFDLGVDQLSTNKLRQALKLRN